MLRWSSGGHLPPLLVEPDGTALVLERPADLLLGLSPETARSDHAIMLTPGATVLLYTDGLEERRDESIDVGLARLAATAAELAGEGVPALCEALLARLAPDADHDIAIIAVRAQAHPARAEGSDPQPPRNHRASSGV